MESNPHAAAIREFIQDRFQSGEITDDQPLLGEILDSIGILTLATHLEDTYRIDIGAHEMDPSNFGTLRTLSDFVMRKINGL